MDEVHCREKNELLHDLGECARTIVTTLPPAINNCLSLLANLKNKEVVIPGLNRDLIKNFSLTPRLSRDVIEPLYKNLRDTDSLLRGSNNAFASDIHILLNEFCLLMDIICRMEKMKPGLESLYSSRADTGENVEDLYNSIDAQKALSQAELFVKWLDSTFKRDAKTVSGLSISKRGLPLKALVVEDQPEWRELLKVQVLKVFPGISVHTAGTYQQGRELILSAGKNLNQAPIIVILDLCLPVDENSLPDMERNLGMDLLKIAREYKRNYYVIVNTTPRNFLSDHRRAVAMGVAPEDYVFKIPGKWQEEIKSSIEGITTRIRGINTIEITVDSECPNMGTVSADGIQFGLQGNTFLGLVALCRFKLEAHRPDTPASPDEICARCEELNADTLPDCIYDIRDKFIEAFKKTGRYLSPEDVIETVRKGKVSSYRLNVHQLIINGESDPRQSDSSQNMRIMILEDEPAWRESIERLLDRFHFVTSSASSIDEALQSAIQFAPNALIVDMEIPLSHGGKADRGGGLIALGKLREQNPEIRAIALSHYAHIDELRREGLLGGIRIDDWIHKNDESWNAMLIRSCLRIEAECARGLMMVEAEIPPYIVDFPPAASHSVKINGTEVILTARRLAFLRALAERPNQPVGTETILEKVYGDPGRRDGEGVLRSLVNDIRKNIEKSLPGVNPNQLIVSISGGYKLCGRIVNHSPPKPGDSSPLAE